jgi:hypothetical protein
LVESVNLFVDPTSKRFMYAKEAEEASMKDVTTALLASLFVLITLVSLISADPVPHGTNWAALTSSGSVSELEFRYALRR